MVITRQEISKPRGAI